MITLDVKYFSPEDYEEAKKFLAMLREWMPVEFHTESCNKINLIQLSSNDVSYLKKDGVAYHCGIDQHALTERIVFSGVGSCYALPSKVGDCRTCGKLQTRRISLSTDNKNRVGQVD